MTSEHTCVTDDQHVVIMVTFLSESKLPSWIHLSSTNFSLCLSLSLSQPQGQHLFYVPSVTSFLDWNTNIIKALQLHDLQGPGKAGS